MRREQRMRAGFARRQIGPGGIGHPRAASYVFRSCGVVSLYSGLVIHLGEPIFVPAARRLHPSACCFGVSRADSAPKSEWGIPMSAEKSQNVQDVFLNHVRKHKTPVTVFLVNGVKLQGIITWFDNFSVLLRRDGHTQLVYKHAISTVMPGAPIQLFDAPAVKTEASTKSEATGTLTIAPRETVPAE